MEEKEKAKEKETKTDYKSIEERFNEMRAQRRESSNNDYSSKKDKKILIVIVGLVLLALIGALLTNMKNEKAEQERIDSIAQTKKSIYDDYMESIEGLVGKGESSNSFELIKLSDYSLGLVEAPKYSENFAEVEKGDEYLEKTTQIASKNLNEAIDYLLTNDDSGVLYDEIKYTFSESRINEKSKRLVEEAEKKHQDRYERETAKRKADWEVENGISWDEARTQAENTIKSSIQTGMSGSEVRGILGSPNSKHNSSEAEFWNYGDMVLTMKNGYVFGINRN